MPAELATFFGPQIKGVCGRTNRNIIKNLLSAGHSGHAPCLPFSLSEVDTFLRLSSQARSLPSLSTRSSVARQIRPPRRVPWPSVGYTKNSLFCLSQPKSKRFTPPWGPEIFAGGNLNEHIRICAAERPSLFLASAHCPSGRRQCRCPGKPVRECAVPRAL